MSELLEALKGQVNFLKSIYADPSVTLRIREASRMREDVLRKVIADFEASDTKPAKKAKAAPQEEVLIADTPVQGKDKE